MRGSGMGRGRSPLPSKKIFLKTIILIDSVPAKIFLKTIILIGVPTHR